MTSALMIVHECHLKISGNLLVIVLFIMMIRRNYDVNQYENITLSYGSEEDLRTNRCKYEKSKLIFANVIWDLSCVPRKNNWNAIQLKHKMKKDNKGGQSNNALKSMDVDSERESVVGHQNLYFHASFLRLFYMSKCYQLYLENLLKRQ